ncbi:MAG: beta strand repeat-containing protein [Chthoniobacterales bacterium]
MRTLIIKGVALFSVTLLTTALTSTAQTSGNIATQTSQSWSTAPWNITAGIGAYPDSGGTAEFDTVINTLLGTVPGTTVFTMDVTPTISSFTYNSPFNYQLAAGAGGINLDAGGATFDMVLTAMSTPTLTNLSDPITAAISGGGTNGLTKTGNGTLTLSSSSSYTGGTHINGGTLAISASAAIGDSVFGASGAGNDISLSNGATLANNITSGWTTSRNLSLGTGGGQLLLFTAATINGVVSGGGSLSINNSTLTLTNTNIYTGATILNSSFSGLTLSGNGSINQSSNIDLAGILTLTNTTTNNADRLNDNGTITDRGATITMTGNASAATNEVAGALTLANGANTITVNPNAAQQASLNFSSITRQNNSTLFVRGTNLGNTAGNGVAEITSTASPGTLIGGGGAAGSQNISILPWAAGNVSASATTSSSFVTWDSGTGQFRPLVAAEYSALANGESDSNNTGVAAATAISSATTVNAVRVTGTGTLLSGTGGLNITSGALLYSPGSTTAGTISATLNFGGAEGVVSNTAGAANSTSAGLTLSGIIHGTGGLTLNSIIGSNIALTNTNSDYTGTTTLTGGLTMFSGTVASGANSVFGADTSAIVLNLSNNTNLNGMYATAATNLNRNLQIIGSSGQSAFLLTTGAYAFNVNGNIDIANGTRLDLYNTASGSATNAFVLNGNITGAGGISDNATTTTFVTLNGANTYTGGTNIQTATYQVGSDSTGSSGAFGTGTIYFSSTGKIQSKDATAHTIDNNLFFAATPTFTGTGGLTFTGGVNLNGARSFTVSDTAAAGTAFSGVVSNGSLTKTGTSSLSLNSSTGNTYTGGTVLGTSAGVLNVNNSTGSGTGSGTVSIGGTSSANRSTLSGNFTISGATQDTGVLSPGNGTTRNGVGDIGTANFGSSLSLNSNTVVTLELANSASSDQINVGGLLTLGSSAINITTIGGYQAALGASFNLLNWGSLSGTATLNLTGAVLADPVNTFWDTSTFFTDGTVRVVPEPGTTGLCIAGGLALFAAARRRRRA